MVAVDSFICRLPQCFLAYIFFEKFLLVPMVEASAKRATRFSKVRKLFGRDNSLCIFKTKASRGTKLCSVFQLFSIYNT